MESPSTKIADITASYFRYWGKASREEEGGAACHLLPYHCLDVAAVGGQQGDVRQ